MRSRLRHVILFGLLAFSLGFTGHERFVELDGFFNGRSGADFRKSANNVRALLEKGTRGQILSRAKLPSGNYALRIRTINGKHEGKEFWIYYDLKRQSVKTYEKAPAHWSRRPEGPVAETQRDVPAIGDDDRAVVPSPEAIARKTDRLNTIVRETGGQDPGCAHCAGLDNVPIPRPNPRAAERERASRTEDRVRADNSDTATSPDRATAIAPSRHMELACYSMVQSNGRYGEWGTQMSAILKEDRYRGQFTKAGALGKFCPKFDSLSADEKIKAWVWFWQSLAKEESSCRLHVPHGTTTASGQILNPREGYGLWALEKDRNVREDRGPACSNIRTFAGQARCAIDIMYKTQLRRGGTASNSSLKYWGPTYNHRNDRQIMPHMRRFKACF